MRDPELNGTLADRYEIGERLGAGGMGEVYRARDTKLRRDVAIKRLSSETAGDDDHRRRLLREARSAARINHQGVAGLYDVIEEQGQLYLVMELVDGKPLRSVLRDGPVDIDDAVRLMIDTADAVATAHRQGVVHYDLTPGNLMLTRGGGVKVLDFGIAQMSARADPDSPTASVDSHSTGIAGTPPYMAPEVLLGKRADHRADIFSLGIVFYEVLTGQNPFSATTPTAISDRILHFDPPPAVRLNAAVPDSAETVLHKMLAKDPAQRYATVDDLLVDLRAIYLEMTHPTTTGSLTRRGRARRGPSLPVAVAAALVTSVALLWWAGDRFDWWSDEPAAAAVATLTVADLQRDNLLITVLPLVDTAAEERLAARERGLAHRLATELTRLGRSRTFQMVPATAEAFTVLVPAEGAPSAIQTVADARRRLGVDFVLTVDVQQQGDRLRVAIALIDAEHSLHLDGDTVEGTVGAPIDLDEEVGRRVARMLRIALDPLETRIVRSGTVEPDAYSFAASAEGYLSTEKFELAVQQFEQAIRLDPSYLAAHAGQGEALVGRYQETRDGRLLEQALAACRAAIDLDPDDAAGLACRGRALTAAGRLEEAIPLLEKAFAADPTDFGVVEDLANAHNGESRFDRAESVLLESIEAQPPFAPLWDRLGFYRIVNGRYEPAVEAFEQAVLLAPDNYVVASNLGVAYYFLGRWRDAQRAFERTLEINPDYYVAYSNLGTLTFYQGDYAAAANWFERALEVDTTDYQVWHNLAEACRRIPGREQDVDEFLRRALEMATPMLEASPEDPYLHAVVGYYLDSLGRPGEADPHLERAARLADGDYYTLSALAGAWMQRGDTDKALAFLRRAIDNGYPIHEVRADPTYADLRGTPEWQEIVGE